MMWSLVYLLKMVCQLILFYYCLLLREPGAVPGFQVRGGGSGEVGAHLKKLRRAEGGAKIFGVCYTDISCLGGVCYTDISCLGGVCYTDISCLGGVCYTDISCLGGVFAKHTSRETKNCGKVFFPS